MKALIDADLITYRVGFTTEDIDEAIACWRANALISGILNATECEEYECFLTSQDKSNYRYDIDPSYKGNRVLPKPRHYLSIREHLIKQHGAEVISGMEADDVLGIKQTDDTIIVSIDKDLDQIPGKHYNFVKQIHYEVTELEGLRFFYKQILTGDTADNVEGLRGIGKAKAAKYLDHLNSEKELYDKTLELYKLHCPIDYMQRLTKAGQLLKIKRKEGEALWTPPTFNDDDVSEER